VEERRAKRAFEAMGSAIRVFTKVSFGRQLGFKRGDPAEHYNEWLKNSEVTREQRAAIREAFAKK
jgi:hypothetical protein